ncbi:helix-turn-helix domain-containing protein [Streptomyces sp. CA-243310]|uniref:helix-turn-helix domain-containing protein n=1 Tax=Streptomyces sp. CA-243310 TaxID=3240056 RepID=UPI003D8B567D
MTTGSDGLAGLLSGLKKRSGLSYGALAGRLHVSTSTVHRYCNGDAVPTEFGTVERFAKQCGATRDELVEAHRRWIIADDARRRPRPVTTTATAEAAAGGTGSVNLAKAAGTADATPGEAADAGGPHSPASSAENAPKDAESPQPTPRPMPETETESDGGPDPEAGAAPAAGAVTPTTRRPRLGRDSSRSATTGFPARRRGVRIALAAGTIAVLAVPAAYAVTRYVADEPTPSGPSAPVNPSSSRTAPYVPGPRTSVSASTSPTASGSPAAGAGASPDTGASSPAPGRREGSGTPGGTPPSGDGAAVQPPSVGVSSYNWDAPCGVNYLLDQPEGQVPPPSAPQDTRGWARALGAVDAGAMRLQLTAKGRADEAVVITGIDVRVVERAAPLPWRAFSMGDGCGSGITPQTFDIDLDDARPVTRAKDGQDGGSTVPAKGFPFKVSSHDPQVFNLEVHTEGHLASWYLEVGWSSGDRRGTVRVDDGGRPFRTSALEGRPRYGWWPDRSEWVVL